MAPVAARALGTRPVPAPRPASLIRADNLAAGTWHQPPMGRREPWFGASTVWALMLAAAALAGAAITVALWNGRPAPNAVPADSSEQTTTAAYRGDAIRNRGARGWEADASETPSDEIAEFPRRVKTLSFMAPSQGLVASLRPPFVKNWRYQLQNIKPGEIATSPHDLVVIDYSGDNGPFSNAEVERMKRKPDGNRRVVLSYMSIGEAEDYRWYWEQRSSSWLGAENAKWRGNYAVRFWDPGWQQIIFAYVDRLIAAGFDGVYLDKVDEFETMGHRDEMVAFVARIAERAKSQRGDFVIVSQNGDALITDPKFRHAIDAFAREDLLYGEDRDGARNDASSIRSSIKRLKMLTAEGKPVFVVEYPRNGDQAQKAREELAAQGFVGLTAKRALSSL
jgi:cysteinyl-tRNA synthetase